MDNGADVYAVEIKNLRERQRDYEQANTKEHEEMNLRLEKIVSEALKRWPKEVSIMMSVLSGLTSALAMYALTKR